MHPAIRVDNLSKLYRIGARQNGYKTLRETVADVCTGPIRRIRKSFAPKGDETAAGNGNGGRLSGDNFWALKDVSFDVQPGEVVGIIGRNGAGKSTLLKILSRVTEPTRGRIELRGRVGSLLEVGTGFHPELTGRENIYMNGSILGMSHREIARKFDEIVDFSGIEDFLDTPVKRYSSGMYVRLAFAVAAHLEPEILVVDEVLAVGDAAFQKKCLGKMHDVAHHGRTVLFVSHNMHAVATLTNNCILLRDGCLAAVGTTQKVIQDHLADGAEKGDQYLGRAASHEPRVVRATIHTSEPAGIHRHAEPLRVEFSISTPEPIRNACLSFQFIDALGRPIAHLWTFDSERPMCRLAGLHRLVCLVPKCRLYMGEYRMTVHFSEGPLGRKFETIETVCPFEVVMHGHSREFPWQPNTCTYLEEANWEISTVSNEIMPLIPR